MCAGCQAGGEPCDAAKMKAMHREDQFIPELIVRDGAAALDFYKSAFGADEVHRMMTPDGAKLIHGELALDGHRFFVCDEFSAGEGGTCKSPQTLGGQECESRSWSITRTGWSSRR